MQVKSFYNAAHSRIIISMKTTSELVTIRRSEDRGHADHGWLNSYHSFSFGSYHAPAHSGFRSLRVINQDIVAPGGGFPTHPHQNMEIFSYVLEGTLKHQDSMGNNSELKPGQIQLMSAGTGITHSEFNPSSTDPLHFLQIWIIPDRTGYKPGYTEWQPIDGAEDTSKTPIITADGRQQSAKIRQDVDVFRIKLNPEESITHDLRDGRGLWLQVINGPVQLHGTELKSGDGASIEIRGSYRIEADQQPVEALLFDLR